MRSILLSIYCLCFLSILHAQDFMGPTDVCFDDCEIYSFSYPNGNLPYWQVSGGAINTNTGTNIEICWTGPSGQIDIFDPLIDPSSPSFTQAINIENKPNTDIIFPSFPICAEVDSLDQNEQDIPPVICQSVCSSSDIQYFPTGNSTSTYTWEVIGADDFQLQGDGIYIEWPEEGHGSLMLIEENILGCKDSIRYCIEVIDKPNISIGTKTGVNLSDICIGQTVYFESNTNNAVQFEWLTSDGQSSQEVNPAFQFNESGNYTVSLIAATECLCFDTSTVNIIVNEYFTPTIECAGTICSSDQASYYAGENCASYQWSISPNGEIIQGGKLFDNYVTVEWKTGQEGIVTLSTINCDDPDICSNPTSIIIPIISSDLVIEGLDVVCRNGANTYSVPFFEGASYQWNVTGNGIIYQGLGTNTISVLWDETAWEPDTSLIEVFVDHCYLDCSSSASKAVDLLTKFELNTSPIQCNEENTYIYAFAGWNNAVVDWYVTPPNGSSEYLAASNSSSLSKTFTEGTGLYKVRAEENTSSFCNNEAVVFFNIIEKPTTPSDLNGDTFICLGNYYEYFLDPLPSNLQYTWNVTDGTSSKQFTGTSIFYQWISNGPYEISVYIDDLQTHCRSEALVIPINRLDIGEIIGDEQSCIDNIGQYEILNTTLDDVQWSVDPSSAGTIEIVENGNVNVHWHESGAFKLIASVCSVQLELNINVVPNPLSNLNYPDGICPGDWATINLPISPSSQVAVYNETGDLIASDINFDLTAGYYWLEVEDENSCLFKEAFYIDEYPEPEVNISSDELEQLCEPEGLVVIEAYVTNEVSSYEWFLDGNPIGFNNPRLLGAGPGTYQVKVTNHYGCEALSPPLTASCVASTCECRPDGGTAFSYVQNEYCNEFSFTNQSFSYVAGSLVYNFNDPQSGPNNTTTDENPDHTFSHPGHFAVALLGTVPHATIPGQFCGASYVEFITVPAAADFEFSEACANQEMQFNELCNYLYEYTIDSYTWDFGDPASGINNLSFDQNPTHIFSAPGTFQVTLTIETNTACKSRKTYEVIVRESPNIDIYLPNSTCEKTGLAFSANAEDLYDLSWDFGDPLSGAANGSSNPEPIHSFENPGSYLISLSAKNLYACEAKTITGLDVTQQIGSGEIMLDQASPACYGDSIKLTAPAGIAYLWSNGASTQEVFVKSSGIYEVTVSTTNACNYTPEPVAIEFIKPIDPIIVGQIFPPGSYQADEYFGSIEICEGEVFSLRTNYFPNARYQWSIGPDFYLVNYSYLSALAPGEHIVTLSVLDNISGCEIAAEDFKIIIRPRPQNIFIVSDQSNMCEGNTFTFSVDTPVTGVRYHWNNGVIGEQITVESPGYYYCIGINEYGCSTTSNYLQIHALPSTDGFLVGCEEVCFPDTLCVHGDYNTTQYQWLLDGTSIPGSNESSIVINQVGDYQVVLENTYGCSDTTGILSISPKTNAQTMKGKVFLDENQDGLFNGMDLELSNVPVHIMSGNISMDVIMTDLNGNYLFDPMLISSGTIEIDIAGLSFNTTSPTSYSFGFNACIEDQENNFPLIDDCPTMIEESLTLETCPDEPIVYEGNIYAANDLDTLFFTTDAGCDSMLFIQVNPLILPDADLLTTHACIGSTNGSVQIINVSIPGSTFSLDGASYTTDIEFSGLAIGSHTVDILSPEGCINTLDFIIDTVSEPVVDFSLSKSCFNTDEGSLSILSSSSPDLMFALDDNSNYSTDLFFDDLSIGNHTLYVIDANGCEYSYPFDIEAYPSVSLDILSENSCADGISGTIIIDNLSSPNLSFSIDVASDFKTDLEYNNLDAGNHTLWVLDENNCLSSYPFTIGIYEEPSLNIVTENSCEEENTGVLIISNVSEPGLSFAIDVASGFNTDLTFYDLSPGIHTLYILDANDCLTSMPFTIDIFAPPGINLTTQSSCENVASGSVSISTNETGLSYSIDGVTYTGDQVFDDLPIGQHILYVNNGVCDFGFLFNIEAVDIPDIQILSQSSCDGATDGSIEIVTNSANYTFSLDNLTFNNELFYEGLEAGNHSLFVLTDDGCLFEYAFTINTVSNETPTIITTHSCENVDNGIIEMVSTEVDIQYSLDGINFQSNPIFDGLQANNYTVYIMFGNGCEDQISIDIEQAQAMDVLFVDPPTDCSTSTVALTPQIINSNGMVEYLWSDGSTSPGMIATESGEYTVEVIDDCETREYTYQVDLSEAEHNSNVFVPNVFLRDSDDEQSIFKPMTPRNMQILDWEFRVYDRWGNLMFLTDDATLGWDGHYDGEIVNPGVFVWMYDITTEFCEEKTHLRKYGDVTLLR